MQNHNLSVQDLCQTVKSSLILSGGPGPKGCKGQRPIIESNMTDKKCQCNVSDAFLTAYVNEYPGHGLLMILIFPQSFAPGEE